MVDAVFILLTRCNAAQCHVYHSKVVSRRLKIDMALMYRLNELTLYVVVPLLWLVAAAQSLWR